MVNKSSEGGIYRSSLLYWVESWIRPLSSAFSQVLLSVLSVGPNSMRKERVEGGN